jgi:hypothetical protein
MIQVSQLKEFIEEKREQFRLERGEIKRLNLTNADRERAILIINIKEGLIDEFASLIYSGQE